MTDKPKIVVGVVASAQELAVWSQLVRAIGTGTSAAWILIPLIDSSESADASNWNNAGGFAPAQELSRGTSIRPGQIYAVPADACLTTEDGELATAPENEFNTGTMVDRSLQSLADLYGRASVGMFLARTDSAGSRGMQAIKAAGGCTIALTGSDLVQTSKAESHGELAAPDLLLSLSEVPDAIERLAERSNFELCDTDSDTAEQSDCGVAQSADHKTSSIPEDLSKVFELIHRSTGFDLSRYKLSTLKRRIERRMGLRRVSALSEYYQQLEQDPGEIRELARDVHVSVTDFFRDSEAFHALRDTAIPQLLDHASQRSGDDRCLRVWVPGCATGEEAYSIAITIREAQLERNAHADIGLQVFATDIDEAAIRYARAGIYPKASLLNVSRPLRERYFESLDDSGRYRIAQSIRDQVSFATHNILSDPPFSRLSLISCRNLLIYLQRDAQEAAIETFHFALRPQGYLLLGPSESLGNSGSSYRVIDKKWRLYQRLETQSRHSNRMVPFVLNSRSDTSDGESPSFSQRQQQRNGELAALRLVAKTTSPPSVLINSQYQVQYLHGNLIEFLDLPSGFGGMTLFEMLREEPRTRIRAAVYRAARERQEITTQGALKLRSGKLRKYSVQVTPCDSPELGDDLLMVTFHLEDELSGTGPSGATLDSVSDELNREVESLRSDLRSTVEELERANDALRSSNEETMTMNEELQSTNEELETQSEELRSVNEELITVNSQLREKVDELQEAHADIANLLNSTKLPAIFLDRNFCIRRFTPEARTLLNVIESDIGRPIRDLSGLCAKDGMLEDAERVITGLTPIEKEIQDEGGDWYLRRLLPYRTADDRIAGVVVTYSMVTRLKDLTKALTAEREQQRAISQLGIRAIREYDFTAIANYACTLLSKLLHCEFCKLLELLPDRSGLKLIAGLGWKDGLVGNAIIPNEVSSQAGFTLQQSGPVIVPDLKTETRFESPELLTSHGVRSGISVIMHGSDGRAVGVLGVHSSQPRAFDPHQISFVQQVANLLSGTIQRLETEKAFAKSKERFQALADNISQFAWMADETGSIFWYNQRWFDYTGTTLDEMRGWGWQSVHHPDYVDRVTQKFKSAVDNDNEWEDTFPLRSADGEYRWFLSRAMPIHDDDGNIVLWFGTNTDITDRLEAEAELEESRRKLQEIIDNAPAAVFAKDLNGRFIMSNQAHAKLLDLPREEILGKTNEAFPASRERAQAFRDNDLKVATTGEPIEFEETAIIDGEERSFISQKFPLRTKEGKVYAVCGISTDITKRKQDEKHLRMVMAELNHRVKNTLASIQALARVTADNAKSLPDFQKSFSDRLVSMGVAHSLLTRSEWRGATIQDIISSEVMPRVGSRDRLAMHGPNIMLRPKPALALHMAIHELSTNAAKYGALSASDGHLSVLWEEDQQHDEPRLVLRWREQAEVIAPETEVEGFGSRMIRDMVAYELDGEVHFELDRKGIEVLIWFPLEGATTETGEGPIEPLKVPSRHSPLPAPAQQEPFHARVLLVEDNATLARYLSEHLKGLGYTIEGPYDSIESAVENAKQTRPDIALLDVDLDGVHVYPVAYALKEESVPFAFVSGFNAEDLPPDFRDAKLFMKPFDLDAISDWLKDALPSHKVSE